MPRETKATLREINARLRDNTLILETQIKIEGKKAGKAYRDNRLITERLEDAMKLVVYYRDLYYGEIQENYYGLREEER